MNKRILSLILTGTFALPLLAASQTPNILSVSDSSLTPSIIMPESAETDVRTMQEQWYLRNYALIDGELDNSPTGDFSQETIVDRLGRLPTVIEMPYNSVVESSIRFYASRKQLVENMLGLSIYYMPIFEEALNRHNMPLELRYLPVIESALVPTAKSRVGAGGLWQFMPRTGSGLGLEQNSLVDMRFDPYTSSEAAVRYLKQLYQTYNDWSLAIAAYNCGPGNVNKALRRAGGGNRDFWEIYQYLPTETRGYVPAFIAANYIMTYHKEHGISPALARRPLVTDTVHVTRRVHFDQISQVLNIPVEEIRALNPQYRRDIIPGDIRPYSLTLPSLQVYAYLANEDSIVNHNASNYARRRIVQPSDGTVSGSDARGEYVEEETIQWHKVRRGETLSGIARRYGTTVSAIRQLNNCGKKVRRGQRLKIRTVQRRYIESTPQTTQVATTDSLAVDSLSAADNAVASAFGDSTATQAATAPEVRTNQSQRTTTTTTQTRREQNRPRYIRHKVKRGENLSKIARRYGVTVNAIKRANNMAGDRIQAGQRLKIPQ